MTAWERMLARHLADAVLVAAVVAMQQSGRGW